MPLLGQGNRRLWRKTTAPQAANFGPSSSRYDLQLETTYARAAVISGCRRPRWRRALLDAVLLPRAVLSLRADLRESLADERESKWSVGRRRVPSRNQLRRKEEPSRVFADQLKDPFFPCPALSGAAGPKKYGPTCQGRGIACTALQCMPWAPPRRGCAAGTLLAPQAEILGGGASRRPFWGSGRGPGPKMANLVSLWYTCVSSRGAFWYMGSGVKSEI